MQARHEYLTMVQSSATLRGQFRTLIGYLFIDLRSVVGRRLQAAE